MQEYEQEAIREDLQKLTSYAGTILLCEAKLFKTVVEITFAEILCAIGNGDLHFYSKKFPGLRIEMVSTPLFSGWMFVEEIKS